MSAATFYEDEINSSFLPLNELWLAVEPLLPASKRTNGGRGRPAKPDQLMFKAIFYLLRTGIQWKALPRCLGAASTVHDRFQKWIKAGVFYHLWESGLLQLHVEGTLDWAFQSLDGAMSKAPLGREASGPNPTDRGKSGVKRHLLTEAGGLPVGLSITGANIHDIKEVEAVVSTMPFLPPFATQQEPQGFCADRGYDAARIHTLVERLGYEDHIKSRWQEKEELKKVPGYRARRWVCERTHSWMNRFRRILVRWEKKKQNYEAMLHLCCAHIIWKHSILFSG